MHVTSAAMISTNNGIRTNGIKARRIIEITVFVTVSTPVVASPSARPFTTDVVTASSGQSPSSCTSTTLLRQKPVATTVRRSLLGCIVSFGSGSGGEELVAVPLKV